MLPAQHMSQEQYALAVKEPRYSPAVSEPELMESFSERLWPMAAVALTGSKPGPISNLEAVHVSLL